MNNVNYKNLKSNIVKACKATKQNTVEFVIDYDKLKDLVEDINLIPINVGMQSSRLLPVQVPYLGEYLNKSHMMWLSENKFITVVAFIDSTSVDDNAKDLLEKLNTPQVDDPEDDKVKDFAELIANYPCYFATVISYQNNSPSLGVTYEIACRANKVVIRDPNYKYNHKDI